MTIAPQAGRLTITCNSCGYKDPDLASAEPANEKARALARRDLAGDAKNKGWLVRREAGGWSHHCPHCATRRSGDRTRQDRLL
ncbi:hypothetical protein [Martelella mangrovi]|uniref:RNA-binding Zn-ribbon protein involved in translation (DUF1610 family) n=1 Tax=Martelella mangrovi TaxID=1397477 RepID=A0ABV2IH01_9HYPH